VKKINAHITKKVADKLGELFKKDRKAYEEKWDDIGIFVKYGMISEEKFDEKAREFALLKNIDKKYFTLEEYKKHVEPNQTDKDKNVTYLYTSDEGKQHSYIVSAQKRGYDILKFDHIIDSHFINHLEQKVEKTQVKRVDSDTVDKLITKEDKIESVLSKEDEEKIKGLFEKTANNTNMTVKVESMSPDEMPVTITMSEFMRRMKDMAATGGGMPMMGTFPDHYDVTVNANHTIVSKILKVDQEEEQTRLAKQALDLAMLSQNMLTGADLTEFIQRSVAIAAE
jgi:molecular chaperone HtpG